MVTAFLRPDADDSISDWTDQGGGATSLYANIAETSASDTDYIKSPSPPTTSVARFRMSDPTAGKTLVDPVNVSYRFRKSSSDDQKLDVTLKQGSTTIATWQHTGAGLTTSFQTAAQTLTTPQLASITNFNDLFIEFQASTPSVSYDADTVTWAAQVVTNGGTDPSATSKGYVDTLIKAIKAHATLGPNLNTKLDRLYVLANADNAASATDMQSLTSIVNPAAAATVAGTFTSKLSGYQSNGTTGYINTGFNPSTAGGRFTGTSACAGTYGLTNRTTTQTWITIGAYDGGQRLNVDPYDTTSSCAIVSTGTDGITETNANGLSLWVRTDVTTGGGYYQYNGSGAPTSNALANTANGSNLNANIYICCRNSNGTAALFGTDKIGLAVIGGGLTSAEANALAGYINAYMTSLGLNVY